MPGNYPASGSINVTSVAGRARWHESAGMPTGRGACTPGEHHPDAGAVCVPPPLTTFMVNCEFVLATPGRSVSLAMYRRS